MMESTVKWLCKTLSTLCLEWNHIWTMLVMLFVVFVVFLHLFWPTISGGWRRWTNARKPRTTADAQTVGEYMMLNPRLRKVSSLLMLSIKSALPLNQTFWSLQVHGAGWRRMFFVSCCSNPDLGAVQPCEGSLWSGKNNMCADTAGVIYQRGWLWDAVREPAKCTCFR